MKCKDGFESEKRRSGRYPAIKRNPGEDDGDAQVGVLS